jgi:hypothetical protein
MSGMPGVPGDSDDPGQDRSPRPDPDKFDRLLDELTSGTAAPAQFREMSAAERDRQAARARRRLRASRRRGRFRAVAKVCGIIAVVAVLGSGVYALVHVHHSSGAPGAADSPGTTAASPEPGGTSGLNGSLGISVPAFTAADPFVGTPAEDYRNGAAGIAVPAAHRVAAFSAAQVAASYLTTRRLLIAANLDQRTLHAGTPTAFARLLAPQLRSYFQRRLGRRGVDKHGYTRSSRGWVVSFAPGTELVGPVIKVSGTMRAVPAVDSGRRVLRIHFNFLFVYPVQRPHQPVTRMRIVVRTEGNADFAQWDDPGGPLQVWWLPGRASGAAGSRCDVHDGFVHPQFPLSAPDRVHPSGTPVDPYDLNGPASRTTCQAVTRT